VHTLGIHEPLIATEYLALSAAGNSWPLTTEDVQARIACLDHSPGYERISTGDPAIFRRSTVDLPLPACATPGITSTNR
jgi:hypothetical protein